MLKFCKKNNLKNSHFLKKIIDNVLLRTILGVLQHILPRFLVTRAIWCVLEYSFRELSLKKIYNYLNNIDMVLLRTSYICTGTSSKTILDYNLVRFGVCMIKLRHERMLILRCILPPPKKTELPPENKLTPQPPPEKSQSTRKQKKHHSL